MLDKLQTFAEGRYSVPPTTAEIVEEWQQRFGDAGDGVEALQITKRITSTGKLAPDLLSSSS